MAKLLKQQLSFLAKNLVLFDAFKNYKESVAAFVD